MPGSLNASCDRDLVANLFEIERLFVGSVWVEEVEEVHVGLVVGRLVTELVQVGSLSQFCSLGPNVTHRSIGKHTCTLGESIGLNYPHA